MLWPLKFRMGIVLGTVLALASGCNAAQESQTNLFQSALDSGMDAAVAAQTATTQEDWNLVVNHWRTAIERLEAIPDRDDNAAQAQEKIVEYQQNLAIAQQHAQDAAANSPEPAQTAAQSTSASSGSLTASALQSSEYCQSVAPTKTSQSLEVNNLRFYTPQADSFDFDNKGDYIIGCLTNHSNQKIRSVNATYSYGSMNVTMTYGYGTSGQVGGGLGTLSFPGDAIEPNQTVPFRSSFSINQDIPEVELATLNSEAGEVPLLVKISR